MVVVTVVVVKLIYMQHGFETKDYETYNFEAISLSSNPETPKQLTIAKEGFECPTWNFVPKSFH